MLGPVNTPTNLYQSLQDSRVQVETAIVERLPAVASAAEPLPTSATMTIAGNLNIMMLSAPERMSQNLLVLTEVLASVLKMKQEPNEPLTAFAARLIDAIASLPPSEQLKLKLMLSDAFAGLQLRTLLLALRNPQGPEAATLAIYLELYRQKDRDPGARAVISSYRQNDQSTPPPAPDLRRTAPSTPQTAPPQPQPSGAPASAAQSPAQTSGPSTADPSSGAALPDGDTDPVPGPAKSFTQGSPHVQPGQSGAIDMLRSVRERLAQDAWQQPDALEQHRAAHGSSAGNGNVADAQDSPGSKAPAVPSTESSKATAQTAADYETGLDPEPGEAGAGEPASATGNPRQLPSLPLEIFADLAETDLIRTLLALSALDDGAGIAPEATSVAADPDGIEPKPAPAFELFALEGDAQEMHATPVERPPQWEAQLALSPSAYLPEERELLRTGTPREGLPLAFVNYFVDGEDEPEEARAKGQLRDSGQDDGEEAGTQDETQEDETAEPTEEDGDPLNGPVLEERAPEPQIPSVVPQLAETTKQPGLPSATVDPAHTLYLRMSDLA